MNIIVIIPALDPDERLNALVKGIRALRDCPVVVVDDGSGPGSAHIFAQLRGEYGCEVLGHVRNLGKGAALKTAMAHALTAWPDCFGCVTADCDLQHSPRDILRVAEELEAHPDSLVLGTRSFSVETVPFRSRWGNRITSGVFRLKTGVACRDTQTGLRGIPRAQMARFLHTGGSRFEYEMNLLMEAAREKIPLRPVPIRTIYREGERSSHFRTVKDSLRIYAGILAFSASSLASAAVDLLLFSLLVRLLFGTASAGVLAATVLARIFSGCVNFLLNRKWVFRSGGGMAEAVKYALLFCGQMLLSGLLTGQLVNLSLAAPVAKILVDGSLFFLSFFIQRRFIFHRLGGS